MPVAGESNSLTTAKCDNNSVSLRDPIMTGLVRTLENDGGIDGIARETVLCQRWKFELISSQEQEQNSATTPAARDRLWHYGIFCAPSLKTRQPYTRKDFAVLVLATSRPWPNDSLEHAHSHGRAASHNADTLKPCLPWEIPRCR